jgi:phenylacetic acid degradation operon negative regulatory protein
MSASTQHTLPQTLIEDLQASRSLKVWSLIITFFGDAVEPRGGVVAASTLQTVMAVMGVGAGAVRTACSRLAKDGWIERQKQGRNSFYRLSDMGHTPFAQASRQIYAAPDARTSQAKKAFTLIIQNPLSANSDLLQSLRNTGIRLNGSCLLLESDNAALVHAIDHSDELDDMIVLSNATAHFPDWIKRSVCTEDHARRYHLLMERFAATMHGTPTDPLIALATRCLLIHEWRRVLLRNTDVPAELIPADWPHQQCHLFVANLYAKLYDAGEQWMDSQALGPDGPLKITTAHSRQRFSN